MAAITSLSDLILRLTDGSGQVVHLFNADRVAGAVPTAPVAGRWTSLWQYDSSRGSGALAPSAGEAPTEATAGALGQVNPDVGKQLWLLGVVGATNAPNTQMVYDRLAHESGILGNSASAQTLTGCIATRYTGSESVGSRIWLEITTLIGTTATTVKASYTNQDGVSGQLTPLVAIGGTGLREAQRMIPLPLQSGDTGVRSIESVQFTATTGTAGDVTALIVKPYVFVPLPTIGVATAVDLVGGLPGVVEVKSGACITTALFTSTVTVPQSFTSFTFVQK